MRRMLIASVMVVSAVLSGCQGAEDGLSPELVAQLRVGGVPQNHRAHLAGTNEVPSNASQAQGQAVFQLSPDGSAVRFRLQVANIENVTQAHIHQAPTGANGSIVVWLYPPAPPSQLIPGRTDGALGEGIFTAADLRGPLAGQPLSALVAALASGNLYVNVHTSQFPPGEIRGQIQ